MAKQGEQRSSNRKAQRSEGKGRVPLAEVVRGTERLRRRFHLSYDQAIQVAKHARVRLGLERPGAGPGG